MAPPKPPAADGRSPGIRPAAGPDPAEVRAFMLGVLRTCGARVEEEGDGVRVGLPSATAALFGGRKRLRLVFTPEAATRDPAADLVVPGSATLDAAISLARQQGATARRWLHYPPPPAALATGIPHALSLRSGQMRVTGVADAYRAHLLVTFRVACASDDVQETLWTTAVRLSDGRVLAQEQAAELAAAPCTPAAEMPEGDEGIPLAQAMGLLRDEALRLAGPTVRQARLAAEGRLAAERERLDAYYAELRSEAGLRSGDPEIRALQRRRDRLAEASERLRRQYEWASTLLKDDLAGRKRLTGTSWRQARDQALSQARRELRARQKKVVYAGAEWQDLARQLAEVDADRKLLERAQVTASRVMLEAKSRDLVTLLAEVDRRRDTELERLQARHEKAAASAPPSLPKVGGDSGGENSLDAELGRLDAELARRTEELVERYRLTVAVSPVAAALVYDPVRAYTVACELGSARAEITARYLLRHGTPEPVPCMECGTPLGEGSVLCAGGHVVCPRCALRCAQCGRDYCARCLSATCGACGEPVCAECAAPCPSCERTVCSGHLHPCKECERVVCLAGAGGCGVACACCGEPLCAEHAHACPECGSRVCAGDLASCPVCGRSTCTACREACPGCGGVSCRAHRKACALCGEKCCPSCLNEAGECPACAGLFVTEKAAEALEAAIRAWDPKVAGQPKAWWLGESAARFVAVAAGLWGATLYLLDREDGAVLASRRIGGWEWRRIRRSRR